MDVEEAQLIRHRRVIGGGGLDRVARVDQVLTKFTPFTTRPSATSRQGMMRVFSMAVPAESAGVSHPRTPWDIWERKKQQGQEDGALANAAVRRFAALVACGRVPGMETWRFIGAALAAGWWPCSPRKTCSGRRPSRISGCRGWVHDMGLYAACAGWRCRRWRGPAAAGGRGCSWAARSLASWSRRGGRHDVDAFPVQVVWTPLAWHALITALAVAGLGRVAGVWP